MYRKAWFAVGLSLLLAPGVARAEGQRSGWGGEVAASLGVHLFSVAGGVGVGFATSNVVAGVATGNAVSLLGAPAMVSALGGYHRRNGKFGYSLLGETLGLAAGFGVGAAIAAASSWGGPSSSYFPALAGPSEVVGGGFGILTAVILGTTGSVLGYELSREDEPQDRHGGSTVGVTMAPRPGGGTMMLGGTF